MPLTINKIMCSFYHQCFYILLLLICVVFSQKLKHKQLVTLHQWTQLRMLFPTDKLRTEAINNGKYNPSKLLPVDVDIEYGDDGFHRTFLTVPRLGLGVPYSLAVVSNMDNSTLWNPRLEPYPNYEMHESHGTNCRNITSAIRTFIDSCWRLWVVDLGQINTIQYCSPQILVFDLVTDSLVHRYKFPLHLYSPGVSVFTALVVDVGNDCRNTMAYIADPWDYGLIVYDMQKGASWRIKHELMRPDINLHKSNIGNDGIFTISLSPKLKNKDGVRKLYFHTLNSYNEISVPLEIINNASLWMSGNIPEGKERFSILGSRNMQCESEIMDSVGNLYCSLISSNALISWQEGNATYTSDSLRVVAYNPTQLKFVTGLKINKNSADEDELWALSNEPKLFIGAAMSPGNVKFQIIGCRTSNLLKNQECTVAAYKANQFLLQK